MTKDKLNKIRTYLIDNVFRNPSIMFNDIIRDDNADIDLIEIITDLYEYLHQEIYHEPYDYMFHWANKIGADIETGRFDKIIESEVEKNE